jgi:hypothetical protein
MGKKLLSFLGALVAAACVFVLAGVGVLGFNYFFGRPVLKTLEARSWIATPCVIVSSQLETHEDSESGTSYSANLQYRYQVAGRKHWAERYDFVHHRSGGYGVYRDIVVRYSPGTNATCYVNPYDPDEAVLERGLGIEVLALLFVLPCVLVTTGGALWLIFNLLRKTCELFLESKPSTSVDRLATVGASQGFVTLQAQDGRLGLLLSITFFGQFCGWPKTKKSASCCGRRAKARSARLAASRLRM